MSSERDQKHTTANRSKQNLEWALTGGVVDLAGWGATIWLWISLLFIVLPIVVVIAVSFTPETFLTFPPGGFSLQWYEEVLTSSDWMTSLANSLIIASGATIIAVSVGLSLAFALDRYRVPYAGLIRGFGVLPILIPPVIIGVAYMSYFFLVGFSGTIYNLMIAHGIFYSPFPLVLISSGLDEMDRSVEEAAMNLGATRWVTLKTVTFPIIRSNIFSSALFAFILSLNEYIIAFLVSGFTVSTVPIQIFSSLRYSYSPTIAAISVIYIVITTAVVIVAEIYTGGIWD